MSDTKRYYEAIRFLEGLSNISTAETYMQGGNPHPEMYLERTLWLLNAVGNPQKKFRFIHVAGTAGKGTVSTLIHTMLVRSGRKAGLFTSPFATTSLEKIKIGERYVEADLFAELVDELKPVLTRSLKESPHGIPSYYEIFFALSLMAFRRTSCEWAVIEVGCGGTYDATNVIPAPEIGVITTIDYDHMRLLGNTLESIAGNKAGIIKQGSHIWTSEMRPELRQLFRTTCEQRGAVYHEISDTIEFYQDKNQQVAREVATQLGISKEVQQWAIGAFRLPCRFELVQDHPRVILDGAHNAAKVGAAVARLKNLSYGSLHLVIAMAEDKDAEKMLREIMPLTTVPYYTRFQETHRPALNPLGLREKARKPGEIFLDPFQALDAALAAAKENDIVLVIGSFYLSGELRTRWFSEDFIVENGRSF